jgi:penicillin-binding protein 2
LLTPLQLANIAGILANRGYYIAPHLVKTIEGVKDADWIRKYRTKHYTTIDKVHFETVVQGMSEVVKPGGTAWGTGVADIEICGKTGTAQNTHGKDHSLFIAFAPKDNPKIAIAVIIENGGFGATYAAPIATLMIEKYLKHPQTSSKTAMEKRILETVLEF